MQNKFLPYRARYICPMGIHQIESWKVKLYSLTRDTKPVESMFLEHAILLFRNVISTSSSEIPHYEIGYAIVHDCGQIVFILLDYYQNENELVRHLYSINKFGELEPTYHTPSGLSACVWEGEIINFERQKWMDYVLKQFNNPNFDQYLNSFASGEV